MPSASSNSNNNTINLQQQQHDLEKQGNAKYSTNDDVIVVNNETMMTAKKNIMDGFGAIGTTTTTTTLNAVNIDESSDFVNYIEDNTTTTTISSIQTAGSNSDSQNVCSSNSSNDLLNSNKTNSLKSNNGNGNGNAGCPDVFKQIIVTIEHKIRNLEKRKTKLESYREIQSSGKDLSSDQKLAVAKYDAVAATLDFARNLSKQIVQFSKDAEKEQKKQTRKELLAKAQTETAKIREVLMVQNIMQSFSDESVRQDFLNGENGAVKLDTDEIEVLDKFFAEIKLQNVECEENINLREKALKTAELYSMTIDARPKPYYNQVTYEQLHELLQKIQNCGYLETKMRRNTMKVQDQENIEGGDMNMKMENKMNVVEEVEHQQQQQQQQQHEQHHQQQQHFMRPPSHMQQQQQVQQQQQQQTPQAPPAAALPVFQAANISGAASPVFNTAHFPVGNAHHINQTVGMQIPAMHVAQQQQQAANMTNHFAGSGSGGGGPLYKIEQAYVRHQQYMQQMRPLAEVIGSGNFYFLQESELDTPELDVIVTNGNMIGLNVAVEQQQQQQQPQQQLEQAKVPEVLVEEQQQQQQQQKQQQIKQQQQLIATQTFTNQLFPTTTSGGGVSDVTSASTAAEAVDLYEKMKKTQYQQLLAKMAANEQHNPALKQLMQEEQQPEVYRAFAQQKTTAAVTPTAGVSPAKTPSPALLMNEKNTGHEIAVKREGGTTTPADAALNAWESPLSSGMHLGYTKAQILGIAITLPVSATPTSMTMNRNKWSNATTDIGCTLRKNEWSAITTTVSSSNAAATAAAANFVDTFAHNHTWNGVATTAAESAYNRSGGTVTGNGNGLSRNANNKRQNLAATTTTANAAVAYARGRNNFHNTALAHNGNSATENTNRSNSGIFFRNNENVANIFQNGNTANGNLYAAAAAASNKESRYNNNNSASTNDFRSNSRNSNARNNNNNNNTNARALLRGSGAGVGAGGTQTAAGNSSTTGVSTYITPRQSYRIP